MAAAYRPRDIVRVGDPEFALHAEIVKTSRDGRAPLPRRGRLIVRPVAGGGARRVEREVRTAEITAHWRRVR